MSQTDERIFALMAHAEDLQRVADKILDNTAADSRKLETEGANAVLSAIRGGMDRAVKETKTGFEEAAKGLKEAAGEAQASSAVLRRTGLMQGVFLLAVALVVGGVGFAVMGFIGKSKLAELAELKATIREERTTLSELQAETWGLILVHYDDGTRGIILPKGVKVERTGALKDGRGAIIIKP